MEVQNSRKKQAMETKETIFQCAVELFAQNSYEKVTVSDICRHAKVSIGAFYHHFKNKENILNEGYRLFDSQLKSNWEKGHPDKALEALHFLVDDQMKCMEQMGALAASQYFKNQLSNEIKYILDKERFFYRTICEMVEKGIEAGSFFGDCWVITEDILSTCRGIIYDWCLHEGSYDLAQKGKRSLKMVLYYYGRKPE